MALIRTGEAAPTVPGTSFADGPTALAFYKVTCPVCEMAGPKFGEMERAYPGRVVGVGQDPEPALEAFGRRFGMTGVRYVSDDPPYPLSDAYGIESVPTLVLVGDDGRVVDAAPLWERASFNRLSGQLAHLTGTETVATSDPSDGLPETRPG